LVVSEGSVIFLDLVDTVAGADTAAGVDIKDTVDTVAGDIKDTAAGADMVAGVDIMVTVVTVAGDIMVTAAGADMAAGVDIKVMEDMAGTLVIEKITSNTTIKMDSVYHCPFLL
jgi:uncharacterized iron-regulated protein